MENYGRVEVWRGGIGRAYPLAAPFGWRCLTGPTMLRFQKIAHRTGRADFPHPVLGEGLTLSVTGDWIRNWVDSGTGGCRRFLSGEDD